MFREKKLQVWLTVWKNCLCTHDREIYVLAERHFDEAVSYFARRSSVELSLCGDDVIATVDSWLVRTDQFGTPFGDPCTSASTFAAFCQATVRCRFTQQEFRAEVQDVCGAEYDEAQISFRYSCLSGKDCILIKVCHW